MRKRILSIERWNTSLSLIFEEWKKLVKKEHIKGEKKFEVAEMVFTIVGARTISANDQIQGYKL